MVKRPFLIAAIAVFIGGSLAGAWSAKNRADGVNEAKPVQTATKMRYRTLSNGVVVYEERPEEGSFSDIAPAAGGDSAEPQYRYDPLTQTYRRSSVDMQGNSGQDIINTNR